MNLRRWLTVGIGVKRWLLVAFIGLIILALGVAHVVRQMTAALPPDSVLGNLLNTLTLQSLPYELRGLILGTLGATLFLAGAYRLVRALVDPFALWDRDQPMVEVIYQKRFLARGPRVVAIGCTGGWHRSIVISEQLAAWLRTRELGPVSVFHRELER